MIIRDRAQMNPADEILRSNQLLCFSVAVTGNVINTIYYPVRIVAEAPVADH